MPLIWVWRFSFFNDTATTEIYTLSLHDALPILNSSHGSISYAVFCLRSEDGIRDATDRKSTRLNSSHGSNSYAVFCLKIKRAQAQALGEAAQSVQGRLERRDRLLKPIEAQAAQLLFFF